jgi:hypothetical protein
MDVTTDFKPTPRQIAEMFLELDSIEMAEFFTECKAITAAEWEGHGIYGQALYVADEMKVGTPGADFLMDLAAPWYTHTLRYIDAHGERERA